MNLTSHLFLNADGGDQGDGGTVMIDVSKGALKLGPISDSNVVSISTLGGAGATSGTQDIAAKNGLTLESGGIRFNLTTGVSAQSLKLAAPSGTLRLNGSLRAEGTNPTMEFKGGDINMGKGRAFIVAGRTGSNATGTLRIIGDNSASPTNSTGDIVLNDSIIRSSNIIEIAGSADSLNLDVKGVASAGTIVIRNSKANGNLNIRLFPTTTNPIALQAGKIGLGASGSIALNSVGVPVGAAVFSGQLSVGRIDSTDMFISSGKLSGAANAVNLGTTSKYLFPSFDLTEIQSSSTSTLSSDLTLNGPVTATNAINLTARAVNLSSSRVESTNGSVSIWGIVSPTDSGNLTIRAGKAAVVAGGNVDLRAERLTISASGSSSGPQPDIALIANSISISNPAGGACTELHLSDHAQLTSTRPGAQLSVKSTTITLNENAGIRTQGFLLIESNSIFRPGFFGQRAHLYGESVFISSLGQEKLSINEVDISSAHNLHLYSNTTFANPGILLANTNLSANDSIGIATGAFVSFNDLPQIPGSAVVSYLSKHGNVFLNVDDAVFRIETSPSGGVMSTNGSSSIIVDPKGGAVFLDNAHIESGVLRPICATNKCSVNMKLATKFDANGISGIMTSVSDIDANHGSLALRGGELLCTVANDTEIALNDFTLFLKSGSVVHLQSSDHDVSIRNLSDNCAASVRVRCGSDHVQLSPGMELSTGSRHYARRCVQSIRIGHAAVTIAEFSMVAFLAQNVLARNLHHTNPTLRNKILRMAACIATVTRNRSAYNE